MKLTKREQILLYFLLCFILVMAGAFLLVMPQLDRKNIADVEVMNAKNRFTALQSTINQYGDLDSAIAEKNEQILEIEGKFYQPMPNEDVDQLIKLTLTSFKMTPLSMDIAVDESYSLTPFGVSRTQEQTGEGEDTGSTINLVTVSVSFDGDRKNIAGLVQAVATMEAYQVGSLIYDVSDVEAPITMTFKLYVL